MDQQGNAPKGGNKNRGQQGGKDVTHDAAFLPSFLNQALGGIANTLGHRGYAFGPVGALLTFLTGLLGETGAIQGINILVAAIQSSTVLQSIMGLMGWSPTMVGLFRETLDELFDGIKEAHLEKGRLTEQDATRALGKVLKNLTDAVDVHATFPWAASLLSLDEQVELTRRVMAFRANPEDAQRFDAWKLKLSNPRMLRVLLTIEFAEWRDHLTGLFGNPIIKAPAKHSPSAIDWIKRNAMALLGLTPQGETSPEVEQVRENIRTYTVRQSAANVVRIWKEGEADREFE